MQSGDRRAVQPLISELQREGSWSRPDAAIALGRLGDPRAVKPLCAALRSRDPLVCFAAGSALAELRDKRAADALLKVVEDGNGYGVTAAAYGLAMLGERRAVKPIARRLESALLRLTGNDKDKVATRNQLLPVLFSLGYRPQTMEQCVRLLMLTDSRPVLCASGGEVVPLLLDYLKAKDSNTRFVAAETLTKIGDERAVPGLLTLLEHHSTPRLQNLFSHCGELNLERAVLERRKAARAADAEAMVDRYVAPGGGKYGGLVPAGTWVRWGDWSADVIR
jgi:HEAT repeat protein